MIGSIYLSLFIIRLTHMRYLSGLSRGVSPILALATEQIPREVISLKDKLSSLQLIALLQIFKNYSYN